MNIVRPRILGHRGAILPSRGFQQNSLPAFQEAVEAADGFETDACVSRDGQVFLTHEAKYVGAAKGAEYCAGEYLNAPSRAALGPRRIDQLSVAELRALRLSDGSSLPTLEGALQFVYSRPDKLFNIELKAGVPPRRCYPSSRLRWSMARSRSNPWCFPLSITPV